MMYTPTPAARRPRPPASLTRPRTISGKAGAPSNQPSKQSSSSSSSQQPDTPLSTYIRRRQEYSRTGLARISASPSDVSLSLDVEEVQEAKPIGLGMVEPSPPPPYGTMLPDAPTPPRQDSGVITRRASLAEMDGEGEGLSEEDVTISLRAMRESLRRREDELAEAVSALHRLSPPRASSSSSHYSHQHDPYVGFSDYLTSPPRTSASPPDRPFRTIRANDTSLPYPLHNSRSRPQHTSATATHSSPQYARLQAEADERIATLEQALAEARESEEAQRKLAARLRRDFDKLQRDFERAEERMAREPIAMQKAVPTPKEREAWRRREYTVDKDLRASYARAKAEEESRAGWGSTAFPEFTAGPSRARREPVSGTDLSEVTQRLEQMSVETVRSGGPAFGSMISSNSVQQVEEMTSPGSTISTGSTTVQRADTLTRRSVHKLALPLENRKVRKKISVSNFAGPPKTQRTSSQRDSRSPTPLSPRLRVDAVSPNTQISSPPRSYKRSPWPSPQPRITPASPTSLGSKMASMRSFVANNLGLVASPARGRTLGSELGSEFGDDWDQRLHSLEDINPASSEDESDHYSEPPAPLPPSISAALSSLATALAPHNELSGSILPKGLSREPSLDAIAYGLLGEAVRGRRINWGETDKHLEVFSPDLAGWGRAAGPLEMEDRPDDFDESTTVLQPSRLYARPRLGPMRTVSSGTDASVALAHRRKPSNLPLDLLKSSRRPGELDEDDDDWEPNTIPARVVHDLICIMAIIADWIECAIIVIYRIVIDIRYGRKAISGLRKRAKMRRYYL